MKAKGKSNVWTPNLLPGLASPLQADFNPQTSLTRSLRRTKNTGYLQLEAQRDQKNSWRPF